MQVEEGKRGFLTLPGKMRVSAHHRGTHEMDKKRAKDQMNPQESWFGPPTIKKCAVLENWGRGQPGRFRVVLVTAGWGGVWPLLTQFMACPESTGVRRGLLTGSPQ